MYPLFNNFVINSPLKNKKKNLFFTIQRKKFDNLSKGYAQHTTKFNTVPKCFDGNNLRKFSCGLFGITMFLVLWFFIFNNLMIHVLQLKKKLFKLSRNIMILKFDN